MNLEIEVKQKAPRSILYVRVKDTNKDFLEKRADQEGISTSSLVDLLFDSFRKQSKKSTAPQQEPSHDRPKTRLRKRSAHVN